MNNILVFFVACVIIKSRGFNFNIHTNINSKTNINVNPFVPLVAVFKNGAIPTIPALNTALDNAVVVVRNMFNNNTIRLPDFNKTFEMKDSSLTLELIDGELFGLGLVYRDNDCSITVDQNFVIQRARYAYEALRVGYDYKIKFNGNGPEGRITAEVPGYVSYIDIRINRQTMEISLYKFRGEITGRINITIDERVKPDLMNTRIIKDNDSLIQKSIVNGFQQFVVDMVNEYNSKLPKSRKSNKKYL